MLRHVALSFFFFLCLCVCVCVCLCFMCGFCGWWWQISDILGSCVLLLSFFLFLSFSFFYSVFFRIYFENKKKMMPKLFLFLFFPLIYSPIGRKKEAFLYRFRGQIENKQKKTLSRHTQKTNRTFVTLN